MLKKQVYVNVFTKKEFDSESKCLISENKSKGIASLFSFWTEARDTTGNCNFSNGEYCYQRTREEVTRFGDALFIALKRYARWIDENYKKEGGIKREYVNGRSIYGRFLSDGDSELYHYWCILGNICPICFREYGQMYYADNCTHTDKIETKKIRSKK